MENAEGKRFAVYGAGAMGTVLGAYISAGGAEADLFSRNVDHVGALRKNGARVTGEADFSAKVRAFLPSEMEGEYDVIILLTKQSENDAVLDFLLPHLKADGAVCTLQNGLPEEGVARKIGKERTLGCVVSWGASLLGPGVVAITSSPKKINFALGSPFGKNRREDDAEFILSRMGKVTREENFSGARVAKLSINAAFSPLSGMSGKSFGEIAADKDLRGVALSIIHECFSAADALGVKSGKLQGHDIKRLLDFRGRAKKALSQRLLPVAMKNHAGVVSGMYHDLKAGKKSEAEYINGELERLSKKAGTLSPVNSKALDMIREIERGERQISEDNLCEIAKFVKNN